MPSRPISREITVNDAGQTVDRRTSRDLVTGEFISEDAPTDYKIGRDGPAITYISGEAGNEKRWQEVIERKKEKWADQQAEQQAEMNALGVGNSEQATQLVKDQAEMRLRQQTGHKTFGGLGGLLGPNGTLARRARGEDV
ncbi:MAG: hypothetical protein AB7V46_25725 [Thermomicrobiales bacterium]